MPQETSKIEAKEIKVRDLLSNHLFEIPKYHKIIYLTIDLCRVLSYLRLTIDFLVF